MRSIEKLVLELQESEIFLSKNEDKLNGLDRILRVYDLVPVYGDEGIIKGVKGCISLFPKKVLKELYLDERTNFKELCEYIKIYNKRKKSYESRTYLLNAVKKISKPKELLKKYFNNWKGSIERHSITLM